MKRSKYESVVKTAEDLANEANKAQESESSDEEVEMEPVKPTKKYTVDDIMGLGEMKIAKKKNKTSKQNQIDVEMSDKSKGIKKEKQPKRKKRVHEKRK